MSQAEEGTARAKAGQDMHIPEVQPVWRAVEMRKRSEQCRGHCGVSQEKAEGFLLPEAGS